MNNVGTSLVKLTLLAGGAVLGTLIARWLEEVLTTRAQEESERDRTRYEQGLAPIDTPVQGQQE